MEPSNQRNEEASESSLHSILSNSELVKVFNPANFFISEISSESLVISENNTSFNCYDLERLKYSIPIESILLKHEHIINYLGTITYKKKTFLVQEQFGKNLKDVIKGGSGNVNSIAAKLIGAIEATIFLLSKGCYSFSVCPNQLVLNSSNNFSLLVQEKNDWSRYRSPEDLIYGARCEKSFVWSFGWILYFCASGKEPYEETIFDNLNDLKYKICEDEFPKTVKGEEEIDGILDRVLRLDRNQRIGLYELVEELRRYSHIF